MSGKTPAVVLACAILGVCLASPVAGDEGTVNRSSTAWGVDDGLPQGDVLAMTQDRDGFLWIGMSAGLVRFDGHQFVPWGSRGEPALPGHSVQAIVSARDGSLWAGHGDVDGVTRIQGGRITLYSPASDGPTPGGVSAILEDRSGAIWVGTNSGLSAFAGGRWQVFQGSDLPAAEVFSLHEDRQGTVWVGTSAGVYRRAKDDGPFVLADARSTHVQSFVEDASGAIWVTDSQHVMRRLDGGGLPKYAAGIRLPTAGWRSIRAHDGTVWIAALGGGLLRVPGGSGSDPLVIERAGHEDTIVGSPRSLFQDRQSNVWVGMRGGGLVRISETIFATDVPLEGLTNDGVRGLAGSNTGDVWVATGHHLNVFSGRSRRVFDVTQTLALHVDTARSLWVSTAIGVGRFEHGRLSALDVEPGIRLERVVSITTDPSGRLWLCSVDQGLLSWTGAEVARFTDDPSIAGRPCNFLYTDTRGRVWIAFARLGLAVYHGGRFEMFATTEGAPAVPLIAISEDTSGAIWIGTASSITRFQDGRFATIGPENGLPGKLVPAIVDDGRGYMWVGVQSGSAIVRFHRGEVDAVAAHRSRQIEYTTYDSSDGLQGELHWQSRPAAVRGRDGMLWFVTGRGIAVVDPLQALAQREPAPLRIEHVVVGGDAMAPEQQRVLPHSSSIEMDYTAASLSAGSKFRFRHLLEGHDADWIDAGSARHASYADLPTGSYRFRVTATGTDERAGAEAVWSFVIAPPFYQTAWFYAATAGFVGLSAWGYWRLRLRAVRRQFAMVLADRASISREIHDTLLQSLGAVGLELEVVASQLDTSQGASRDALRHLRRRVGSCITEARQSILELRSPVLNRASLAEALRELADDVTVSGAVEVTVAITGRAGQCPRDVAHHVLRIAQEATNNAIRHGRPKHVSIALEYRKETLTLRVHDDGCGFSAEAPPHASTRERWGLVNMQERAVRIGGSVNVTSTPGSGTTVEMTAPLD